MLSHFVLRLPPSRLLRSIDACSTEKERERGRESESATLFAEHWISVEESPLDVATIQTIFLFDLNCQTWFI